MSSEDDEDDFGDVRAETPEDSVEGDGAKKKRKDKKRRKRTPEEKEARRLRKEAEAAAGNPGGARPSLPARARTRRATTAP